MRSELHGDVTTVTIHDGKVGALDVESLRSLIRIIDDFECSASTAMVITGTGRSFSAGVNLRRVLDGGERYLNVFLPMMSEAFLRLFELEKPVVAAVNGHALAGGCIITSSCDHRYMADGAATIGISELRVGVPFPTVPLEIMRFVLPSHLFSKVVLAADGYPPVEALRVGLIDEVVEPGSRLQVARAKAEQFASIPPEVFRITKRQMREPTLIRMRELQTRFDTEVESMWRSPAVLQAIDSFVETLGR